MSNNSADRSGGPKRVGNPFASPSPRTDLESLLEFYYHHPTSHSWDHESHNINGSRYDDDLESD